jgi:ureidoglycolate lyase
MTAKPAPIIPDFRTIEIPTLDLTPEAFAPFGEVSRPRARLNLDFANGTPSLCEVRVEPRPLYADFLARHLYSTQTFVPLAGTRAVLLVAPPSDLSDPYAVPDLTRLAAFRLDGAHAVTIRRGTWHRAPFPVGGPGHFLVLDREGTLDDMDLVDLKGNCGAEITVRL